MPTMAESFKIQFLESLSALIVSAFGLVAALAWNETIKQAIAAIFESEDDLLGQIGRASCRERV